MKTPDPTLAGMFLARIAEWMAEREPTHERQVTP